MNKFNSRARCRFASMRKRRAFGPRYGERMFKGSHYHVRFCKFLRDNAALGYFDPYWHLVYGKRGGNSCPPDPKAAL